MTDPGLVAAAFQEIHGSLPRLFRAPGRVNLIGEHTDYNDGFVLPVAIDRDTVVGAAPRQDRRLRVRSLNRGEVAEFDLDAPPERQRGIWLDYVEGVARVLEARGHRLGGAELVLRSDVPPGAGLSSSASLEVSVGLALLSIAGHRLPPIELAQAGQAAEHEYVGAQCGIMDQLVAVMGRPAQAVLIDCRSLEARPVPLALGRARLLVVDSGVKHELASSAYNERRVECGEAVARLRAGRPDLRSLRDLETDELGALSSLLPPALLRRARHVVSENRRTLDAAAALTGGDLVTVGKLMAESHRSLRDDYEVSCAELDLLVETAASQPNVAAARMTGGGFGGCTVNLVDEAAVGVVVGAVSEAFDRRFGRWPRTFVAQAAGGAGEIT